MDLARYVPRHLLAEGRSDTPRRRDFDGVALMLDIAGFTELTETFAGEGAEGAERLSAILDAYFGCMTGIAVAHGGDVLDFVGDALQVAWEYGETPGATAMRAIQCGLALQHALPKVIAETRVQLRQRVSIAQGRLTHFTMGGVRGKWHHLTAGPALAEAAAANRDGGPGNVVVGASLWEMVRGRCEAQPLARGKAAVMRVIDPMALSPAPLLSGSSELGILEKFLAQPLLERLRVGGSRWIGEFRNITTIFIGVPGMDCAHEDALSVVQALVESTQRVHSFFGGILAGVCADEHGVRLLSAFGLPLTAREDDAVRAVAAAHSLAAEMRDRRIVINMGITSGPVFYSDVGGSDRRYAGLTGAALNLASRLMVAPQGGILCDEATYKAAASRFLFETRDPVVAKGFATPVAVWQPLGRVRHERRAFAGTSVGREAEFRQLQSALDALATGQGSAIALLGEAGLGKSRLIADTAARARANGIRVAWGAGFALETASVYFPWRQILAQVLCGDDAFDPLRAREIAASLVSDDECMTSWLPLLNDVLPLQFDVTAVAREMTGQARAAGVRALVVALAARSASQCPLLVVADDLHWFDGASAALLVALAATRSNGLLILAGARPLDDSVAVEVAEFARESRCIDLDPLTHAEVGALVSNCLHAAEASPSLVDFVAARSAGNPFYAEEVVLALRSSGHIELADGVAGIAPHAGSEALGTLPQGLRGVIVSRVDALGAQEQLALKIAAVIGPEFSLTMLHDLLPETQIAIDLGEIARVLEREDVITPVRAESGQYRFKHALLQETVYEQLPFALRRHLHGRIAESIESDAPDALEPRYAALALHWERARNIHAAVGYLESSAAYSLKHFANREAITQASRALVLASEHGLPEDATRETRCEAIVGEAYNELFEYRSATRHYKRALACAGRPVPRHTATMTLDVAWQLAVQFGVRAGLLRGGAGDPLLSLASHVYEKLGEIAYFNSGTLPLLHATLTSLNLAERSGTVREAVNGYAAMAIGLYRAGQQWLSRVYNRRSLALAEEQGRIEDVAYAHLVSGVYWAAQSEWTRAERSLVHSTSLYTRLGAIERCQQSYAGLCAIELVRGHLGRAQEWLDRLRPAGRGTPPQILAYLHGFDTCLALARGSALHEHVVRLREVAEAQELAQFDRTFCQGLIAAACWRMADKEGAVEAAIAGLRSLVWGPPAAWYVTDGLAGIAQTLVDASACGLAHVRDAQRACRILDRYARVTKVAAPRAALVAGRLAAVLGKEGRARAQWRRGLGAAREIGAAYDEALLLYELGAHGSEDHLERAQFLEQAQAHFERIGARHLNAPML
jgi:adenylate cyclase